MSDWKGMDRAQASFERARAEYGFGPQRAQPTCEGCNEALEEDVICSECGEHSACCCHHGTECCGAKARSFDGGT